MRELLEAALERNPNHRLSAADLLKHEALHPPPEGQPRCQSLDSALFERKRLLTRKELELPENIAGTTASFPLLCFYTVFPIYIVFTETNKAKGLQGLLTGELSRNLDKMRSNAGLSEICGKTPIDFNRTKSTSIVTTRSA